MTFVEMIDGNRLAKSGSWSFFQTRIAQGGTSIGHPCPPVQIQAQHGDIEVAAEKDITMTACKGKMTMAAQEEILLTSGGGYIRIKGGNIEIHCPQTVSMKAASHQWLGPDRMGMPMPVFPSPENTWVKFAAHYEDAWNTPWPLSNLKVKINNKLVAEEY